MIITYLEWLKKIVDFACLSIYGINQTTVQLIGPNLTRDSNLTRATSNPMTIFHNVCQTLILVAISEECLKAYPDPSAAW